MLKKNKIVFLAIPALMVLIAAAQNIGYAQDRPVSDIVKPSTTLSPSLESPTGAPQTAVEPAPKPSGGATTIFPAPIQSPVTGKTGGTQIISLPNPLGTVKTIPELIGRIVDWLIFIASIAILPFMIIWGAYQLLMAGGNPENVTKGRHTITWAVIGYALLLISKGIEFIIRDVLK